MSTAEIFFRHRGLVVQLGGKKCEKKQLTAGLFCAVFCIYYIVRGVLQENRQELVVFVLSIVVLMIRSGVNFSVLGSKGKQELLVGLPPRANQR